MTLPWWQIVLGVVWLVGGNLLIHIAMTRVQNAARAEVLVRPVLFEEARVSARVAASAIFGFSVRWVKGDLLVTDRCAVLFQRSLIAQPPIVLFGSSVHEAGVRTRFVAKVLLTEEPSLEGGVVVLRGKKGITSWTLRLSSTRAEELLSAIRTLRRGRSE